MNDADLAEAVRALYDSPRLESHVVAAKVFNYTQQRALGPTSITPVPTTEVWVDSGLPTLAWMSELRVDSHHVVVGDGVTVGPEFAVEGVWDGKSERGRFDRSELFFGSGVRLLPRPIFVPPRHAYEALWTLHDAAERVTRVSNSLTFLLTRADLSQDEAFLDTLHPVLVESTRKAAKLGADRYDSLVFADERYELRRMMFHNFLADADGHVRSVPLPARSFFSTFDDYRDFLTTSMQSLATNGAASSRARVLQPVTSVSSGYDSPAVAALAVSLGFRDGLTFKVTLRGHDDSGVGVGQLLGMDVVETTYPLGADIATLLAPAGDEEGDSLAEFFATDGMGDNWVIRDWEPFLVDKILFTGDTGDSSWDRMSRREAGLPVYIKYGFSLTEFRLRVGFAYVPVPTIGLRFARTMRAISKSAEMARWTLGTKYDRPVARRLAEEAGLPRGSFAVSKSATNPHVTDFEGRFASSVSTIAARYAEVPGRAVRVTTASPAVARDQGETTGSKRRRWLRTGTSG